MNNAICEDRTVARREEGYWRGAGNIITSVAKRLRRNQRRRHLTTLNGLSSAELADMGLRRDDLYEVAAADVGEDVTCLLASIADRRRHPVNASLKASVDET